MSQLKQFVLLAEYNQLMNGRQYTAVANLRKEQLTEDRGAFFESVLGTLNHILVGDIVWLKRFSQHPASRESLSYIDALEKPKKLNTILFSDLDGLKEERNKIDALVVSWINQLDDGSLDACIRYNNMAGDSFNKPFSSLILHLFLHQVHHRGQVTTLLSQYGVDFGETDLIEIVNECTSTNI